jgi:hypothetical protein
MVTVLPAGPEFGLTLVIVGGGVTVKPTLLLATPATVTMTLPVVAPEGTGTVTLVSLQLLAVPAETPLNVTVLVPCDVPKLVPVMVTEVPSGPEPGLSPVMFGTSAKLATLLLTPPTATTTVAGLPSAVLT